MAASKVAIDVAHVKLAQWLQQTHPEIFKAVLARAMKTVPNKNPGVTPPKKVGLAGISDIFSDIGSGISSVASYLTSSQGISTLGTIASSYFSAEAQKANANAQQAVLNAQIVRAQSGQAPLPVTYQATNAVAPSGQVYSAQVPYVQTSNGLQVVTPSYLSNNTPSFLSQYGTYLAIGAGALVLVLLITRS